MLTRNPLTEMMCFACVFMLGSVQRYVRLSMMHVLHNPSLYRMAEQSTSTISIAYQ